jgi:LPXTG-motif cell wall-anchored protein
MKLKTGAACGLALGMTGALALGAGIAHAAPYLRTPILVVEDPNPWPGQLDGVMGFDYASVEHVSVDGHSVPVHLADARTNERGHFRTVVRIPEEWRCSEHLIVGTGDTGDHAAAVVHVRGCSEGHFAPGGPVFFGDDEDDDYSGGPDHHNFSGPDHHNSGGPDHHNSGGPDHHPDHLAPHHKLPGTGAEVAGIALTGGALITAGLAMTSRRRRRARTS